MEGTDLMIQEGMNLGKVFAESGVFPDIKSAAQGAVKILAGKEIGLSALQSLNSFYFVGGRLALMAQAMAALIKKSGKYDYQIVQIAPDVCTIKFFKIEESKRSEIGETTFDKKMAAAAGIINKDNWKNFPANMNFARALSNGARWYCPDVIFGFYTVEEMQDLEPDKKPTTVSIEANGEVVNGKENL